MKRRSTGKPTTLVRPTTWTLREERWFVYEGWNVIAEFDKNPFTSADATLLHAYAWGSDLSRTFAGAGGVGGLLGQTDSTGQLHAVCTEIMGNVMGLVHVSTASATLTDRFDYDAFGKQITHVHTGGATTPATDSSFGFSTKYTDAETGLCYYGYRYYSPEMGRWVSRDPIGEKGGVNVYGMVGNNPVNWLDYLGLQSYQILFSQITFTEEGEDIYDETHDDTATERAADEAKVAKALRVKVKEAETQLRATGVLKANDTLVYTVTKSESDIAKACQASQYNFLIAHGNQKGRQTGYVVNPYDGSPLPTEKDIKKKIAKGVFIAVCGCTTKEGSKYSAIIARIIDKIKEIERKNP